MKQSPILRHIIYGLLIFAPMYFLGLVVPIPIYPIRGIIRNGKNNKLWVPWFLWLFLNDTVEGKDAGDYGRYKHNFFGYYHQCAIRNSHWNLKLLLAPNKGLINVDDVDVRINTTEDKTGLTLCNYDFSGKQFVFYPIGDERYFRFSFSKVVKRIRVIFGKQFPFIKFNLTKYILYYQLGTDNKRYIYKRKIKLLI